MKLKYYLRGLGIGIMITTVILMIGFARNKNTLSDDEIIARAKQLGMVMPEEQENGTGVTDTQSEDTQSQEDQEEPQGEQGNRVTGSNQDEDAQGSANGTVPEGTSGDGTVPEGTSGDGTVPAGTDGQDGIFRLTIKKGDVCRTVCETLAENGVITDAEALRKYLFEIGYASNLSTGDYDVPYGLSMEDVAKVLQDGPLE